MAVDPAEVQEIATHLNILRPDEMRYEAWVGALSSGAYKFGYGLLRSGDDQYDPFGVLAALSYPAWTWDETEEAWAVDGAVIYLRPEQVADWLGIEHHERLREAGMLERVAGFISTVTSAADGSQDFNSLVVLLKAAWERASEERRRLNQAKIRDLSYIGEHAADMTYDRTPYYRPRAY